MTNRALTYLSLAIAMTFATPVFANGGDFFNELSEAWGANTDTGTPFFGFVRDDRGKPIKGVMVVATVRDTSLVLLSDNVGHYKIPGMGKDVNAKEVVISCTKVGFKIKTVDRRVLRSLPNAPIEVNCILSKEVSVS